MPAKWKAKQKRAIDYIETNIVPEVRTHGEKVLRRLSEDEADGLTASTRKN